MNVPFHLQSQTKLVHTDVPTCSWVIAVEFAGMKKRPAAAVAAAGPVLKKPSCRRHATAASPSSSSSASTKCSSASDSEDSIAIDTHCPAPVPQPLQPVSAQLSSVGDVPSDTDDDIAGADAPVVRSLEDAFRWFDDAARTHGGAAYVDMLFQKLDGLRMSTSFSGIGAADVALATIVNGIDRFKSENRAPVYRNLFAIEYDKDCQHELRLLPVPCALASIQQPHHLNKTRGC